MLASGVKGKPDVHAMASAGEHAAAVLISHYHDSEKPGPSAGIDLVVEGLPRGRALVQHYRVDGHHSNSFEFWKQMGSPGQPTPEQYALLERAGQLQALESPRWVSAQDGRVHLEFALPLHGVSLIRIEW
jgi:xylan 1,4-beta-xylosidase